MQWLCYKCTRKETKWQAVKSERVALVFRMFHLDRCLPKKDTNLDEGPPFIWKLRWEIAQGGCDVTTSDTWWYIWAFWQENRDRLGMDTVEN